MKRINQINPRWFFGRRSLELAVPSRWVGAVFTGDADSEGGHRCAFSCLLFAVYIGSGRSTKHNAEYCYGVRADADYLSVYRYRGDDEMNHMPWMFNWPWRRWHHYATDRMSPDETHEYEYVLRSGDAQVVKATIHAERMEWRWLWRGSPFRKVRHYINVKFDGEVGEGAGSWKGGTIGCSYELRNEESPFECLRRMEQEREF